MSQADIALIGLAVMGRNLVLNMNDHGYTVAVFNRTVSKVDEFLSGEAKNTHVLGAYSLEEAINLLKKPRRIMMMVKAGDAVDHLIEQLIPLLEPGDILIDGGNSFYQDTMRRTRSLSERGLLFIGLGVSGGEEGARSGPSLMPGGDVQAWPYVKDMFQSIAAKVEGRPCCEWVGENGAGHYVKMVHNGIEYGDMQIICEAYDLLSRSLGLDAESIQTTFSQWSQGRLDSYLIDITSRIFKVNDEDNSPLVDKVLDVAGQKGTGKWASLSALELGVPLTLIAEAVFSRFLSAYKTERTFAANILKKSEVSYVFRGDKNKCIHDVEQALYASKIISYAQGYNLMKLAAQEYDWRLNYGDIAALWRGGCIIRSAFLKNIEEAFSRRPDLDNLLLDEFFAHAVTQAVPGWRRAVILGVESGVPLPAFSAALSFYDGYCSVRLPANLLQAQRDYFGAHHYERTDAPRGEFFHTDWRTLSE